jgi:hypothetical protein
VFESELSKMENFSECGRARVINCHRDAFTKWMTRKREENKVYFLHAHLYLYSEQSEGPLSRFFRVDRVRQMMYIFLHAPCMVGLGTGGSVPFSILHPI